jgi:hypothetical protein
METPIYQIFIGKNNIASNLAIKAAAKEERDEMFKKQAASIAAHKAEVLLRCSSAWADEEHPWWGLIRYPSLEARMRHTQDLAEMGWLDYVDAFTLLGTAVEEPKPVPFANPIYKLWIIRSNPAGAQAQAGLRQGLFSAAFEKHDAIYTETGSVVMLQCNSYWCNEAYPFFGISAYPNIEANMKVMEGLDNLGWQAFMDCITLLGSDMD